VQVFSHSATVAHAPAASGMHPVASVPAPVVVVGVLCIQENLVAVHAFAQVAAEG
jgi:hypothetical protein